MSRQRGEEIKTYYKAYSNLGGAEMLSQIEADVEECAEVVQELLESEPDSSGRIRLHLFAGGHGHDCA